MPVYAYACTACGNAFDARQSFDEPSLTICETCGGALRKQFGSVGVSFKGSGFYRTDSRAAAKAGAGASGSSAAKSSSGSATTASSGSSAATTSSGSQPAAKTSTASSGGAGTVA
ncbi:putative regulatory protein, FmdB family [Agrococcus baldri]|uniref:Regulatory protein, FmdB family n=1 Tax=Agrococcus baldri TaxID=153730 RepID=A0AA94KYP3_9MICO|nr:FmdB family zinc ribbon protein [Agrococcus baldri]SFS00823.1 putative regulatory protein, FmdB family [Agrococcus baldri]